jgi:hypothetical protein
LTRPLHSLPRFLGLSPTSEPPLSEPPVLSTPLDLSACPFYPDHLGDPLSISLSASHALLGLSSVSTFSAYLPLSRPHPSVYSRLSVPPTPSAPLLVPPVRPPSPHKAPPGSTRCGPFLVFWALGTLFPPSI